MGTIASWPPSRRAQLALTLEVAGTPKPGNVDRHREYDGLRFEHFLAGAIGATPGLEAAADPSVPLGVAFESAVEGMACQRGGNTQFGALLAVCPLVRAAVRADGAPTGPSVDAVVDRTDVNDAIAFYRAFDHVDVAVGAPPPDFEDLDVRRGGGAAETLRSRSITLAEVMALASDRDGIAAEWTNRFQRCFQAAEVLVNGEGPVLQRAARTFLELLADEPDPFVALSHGEAVAQSVTDRASALHRTEADIETVESFANSLVRRDVNPGTTADILAGGLFIALSRGLEV